MIVSELKAALKDAGDDYEVVINGFVALDVTSGQIQEPEPRTPGHECGFFILKVGKPKK